LEVTDGKWQTKPTQKPNKELYSRKKCKILGNVGFSDIHWHMPEETGYYQLIVTARKQNNLD
jgi:hypothetical protein